MLVDLMGSLRPLPGLLRQTPPRHCSRCRVLIPRLTHILSTSSTRAGCPSTPSSHPPHPRSTSPSFPIPNGFPSSPKNTRPNPTPRRTWKRHNRATPHCACSASTNRHASDPSGSLSALRGWKPSALFAYQRCWRRMLSLLAKRMYGSG